eukprot:g11548.t1
MTWTDQEYINKFGRLHIQLQHVEFKMGAVKKGVENLEGAQTEVEELLDDAPGTCKIAVGELFVDTDNEAAEEEIKKLLIEKKAELRQLQQELAQIQEEMAAIKPLLKKKFGQSIRLSLSDEED